MTKSRKVVAIVLAFLMIFSSASVFASAWDATVDDGFALDIKTEFYKQVSGEWSATSKVRPGDTVKARVWLGTDYYSNDSTLLFFYDNTFFTTSYGATGTLEVNTDATSFAAVNDLSGQFATYSSTLESQLINDCGVSSAFLAANDYFLVNTDLLSADNVAYDDSTWLFEFTLTVAAGASGDAELYVLPATIQNSTTQTNAVINVPKGESTGTQDDVWPMWLWDADTTLVANSVSTESSVTFNAAGGAFDAADPDTFVISGAIDTAIAAADVPDIARSGYTFMGWIDADDTTPTLAEVITTPAQIPEDDLTLDAFWLENVDITFNAAGGSETASHLGVTPYSDFADVTDPSRTGYTFMGWSTDGITVTGLPANYPDVDTTYTAVWALNVTVSFNTNGADPIDPITGPAGTPFTATISNPAKTGYYFIKWQPTLPTVFPAQNTTYNAIFEPEVYSVSYYVDGVLEAYSEIEYGSVIPVTTPNLQLADGYAVSGWYTDSAFTTPIAAGATIGSQNISLYAYTYLQSFDAIFISEGVEYARVSTPYGSTITLPTAPTRVGYTFAGWSPAVGTMDVMQDKYFYASWTKDVFTVSYYNGANLYQVYNIANGDELDVPADPVRTGYTFIGWDDDAAATTPITLPQYLLTDSAEYYAVFTVNQYDAVFNSNDGVFADSTTTKTVSTDFGAVPVAPASPTRTGYTFAGWTPALAAMTENGATYEATWTANAKTYNVEIYYMGTDGIYAATPSETLTFDSTSDASVSYTHAAVEGFTPDIANSVLTGIVPANSTTLTLVASYTRNQYTFTTDDDFGSTADATYYYGASVPTPTSPVQTGYTFNYWVDASDAEITFPMSMPAADFTATADWTAIDYDVTYSYSNSPAFGTAPAAPAATTANIGNAMTVAAAPTLAGYTFSGWTTDDATVTAGAYTMPAKAVSFTGSWTAINYSINYSYATTPAGASALPANVTDANIGDVVNFTAPTAPGYTFDGWVVTGAAEQTATDFTVGAGNVTVVGSWTPIDYTVTYSYDSTPAGATALPADIADANIGDVIAFNAPTAPGYTFDGWVVTGAASHTATNFTVGTSNITVEGSWTAIDYTITYSYNGTVPADATALPANVADANIGDVVALTAPTATGYSFNGWVVTGAASQTAADFTVGTGNITVVGSWTAGTYNATFEANGGVFADSSTSQVVPTAFDADIVAPAAPTRTGYTFSGWTPTVGKMDDVNGKTFTAVWTANNYNATFVANGGKFSDNSTSKDVLTAFDATPVAPADPTMQGFVFAGWSPTLNVMDTVGGETYTAQWNNATDTPYTVNTYTMGTDGLYGAAVTQVLAGTTNAACTATYTIDAGFELNTDDSVLTGTIAADGSTVLSVYIDRLTYTFTTDVDGVTTDTVYYFDATVTTPADPTKTGYTFAGWSPAVPATMPAEDVTVTATWTANTDTAFTVAITYYNNVTSANVTVNQAFTGTTGYAIEIVSAMPATPAANTKYILYSELQTVSNYTLDTANASNEFTGNTIAADGSTVVDVYYTAVQYTVTFNNAAGGVFQTVTQPYGTILVPPATTPTKYGYSFAAWSPAITGTTRVYNARIYNPTFTANEYDARFFINAGDTTPYYTVGVNFDDSIVAPAGVNVPVKQGYTFVKWVDGSNADVTFPTVMDSEDGRDFYAVWTPAIVDYTINTYVMDTAGAYPSTPSSSVVEQGYTEATATTAPTAATGFTLDTVASTLSAVILPDGSTVLSVYFSRNQYTITTDVLGTTTDYTDYFGAALTIADPTRTGYTFAGWVDAENAAASVPATIPAESYTLTATWAPALVDYTINTYIMDTTGAYPTLPSSSAVEQGYTEATATTAPTAATGFTLDTDASTLSAVILADGSTVLSVYFSRNQYTITTNANNNVGTDTNVYTFYYLEAVSGIPDPVRTGYDFLAWNPALPANMPAADSVVTATWAPVLVDYTINTYVMDVDGNYPMVPTSVTEQGYTEATATTAPTAATGFTLDTVASTLSAPIAYDGSTVLSVYFSRNQYTITTDIDGVTTDYTDYYEAGLTIADPSKTGYTFAGWVDADSQAATIPATIPAESYTVTATWAAIDYSITYSYTNAPDYGTAPDLPETTTTNHIGDVVDIAAAPTLAGYTFSGWTVTGAASTTATTLTMGAGDVTVTGSWTAIDYTVSYEYTNAPAFGTAPALPDDATVNIGDEMTVAAAPTLVGYTFSGWTTADATVTAGAYTVPASDVTFTGTWTAIDYDVTYSYTNTPDYGTAPAVPAATTANIGDAMTVAAAPTLAGYTFSGWTTADATVAAGEYTMPANAVAFVGTWTAIDYNVTYSYTNTPDYGTAPAVPASAIANIGDAMTVAAAPTLTGYTFSGWTTADATVAAGAYTMPANAVAFVGTWTAIDYAVTYAYTGTVPAAAAAAPTAVNANIGDSMTVAAAPTLAGYTFSGWTTADATVTAGAYTMPANAVAFTGSWTAIDYTITYSYSGTVPVDASALPANVSDANIDDVVNLTAPTATGYAFNGWVVTGAASQTASSFTVGAGNVTVVGSWTANAYNATFLANGGKFADDSTSKIVPTAYNASIVAPADPTRTGYTFNGWTPAVGIMDSVSGKTFTAVWTANSYNATFLANGGEFAGGLTTVDVLTAFDATPVAPTAPTMTGFIFAGWSPALNVMNTVGGETYTAQWVPDTATAYTVITRTMDTTGAYVDSSVTLYGTTGDAVDATPASVDTGFTLNTSASTLTGIISALGDTVLTVVIDRNQYTFTVDNNNGDALIQTTYYFDAAVTTPTTPAKTGYTFSAWSPAVPATMPAADTTVEAVWTANSYDAVFYALAGDAIAYATVPTAYDATPVAPADPTRDGYTFAGWSPAINVMDTVGGETYTATWTANAQDYTITTYTMRADGTYAPATVETITGEAVTAQTITLVAGTDYTVPTGFELGAASVTSGVIPATGILNLNIYLDRLTYTVTTTVEGADATYDFLYGADVTGIPDPTKTGYAFAGWVPALPATMPAEDISATATFTAVAVTYTVNYYYMDLNGDYSATPDSVDATGTATSDASHTITPAAVTGFTLDGAASTLTLVIAADGTSEFEVYYERNQYTFTVNNDNGDALINSTYYYGAAVSAPATPVKSGYTFASWAPAVPATMPANAVTVVAQWSINSYNASFFFDEAATEALSTTVVEFNSDITEYTYQEQTGYTFLGWALRGTTTVLTFPQTMGAADVEYVGVWSVNSYTATFRSQASIIDVQTVAYGSNIVAPAAPVRVGYTFLGWALQSTTTVLTFPQVMGAANVIYMAQWQINNYDITYYVDGALFQTIADQNYNTAQTTIAEPTMTGYTFSGWSSADVTITAGAFNVPAKDVRIDGTFTANTYDVTFDAGLGTFTSNGTSTLVVPVDFDAQIAVPEQPVRAGYTFTGWVDADSAAVTLPIAMTTAGDITLTATWSADTKTYYVDIYEMTTAGTYEATPTQTLSFDSVTDAAVSYTAPAIDGFTVDATSVLSGIIPATGELRLVLNYARNQYTFNVTVDGAITETTTDYFGAAITAPATPTKTGYTFAAWVDSESAVVVIPATMPLEGLDVFASWTVNSYEVTWIVDGVETVESYDFGDAIILPATPTKTGYTFAGWSPAVDATMPANDVTYTATWSLNSHTATYDANGGWFDGDIAITTKTFNDVDYGTTIPQPALAPEMTGFVFNGWSPATTLMPDSNINFQAQWIPSGATPYTVVTRTMNTAGAYVDDTQTLYGVTNDPVDATPASVADGFSLNTSASTLTGFISPLGDTVLTVVIDRDQYDVTFDGDTTVMYYGAAIIAPTPTRTGYTFLGWSPAVDATVPLGGATYTSTWSVNSYDITYYVDNVLTYTDSYDYDAAVTARDNETRLGYTFSGWSAIPATMPASDVRVDGTFSADPHVATFSANGGYFDGITSVIEKQVTANTDAAFSAPADPERVGYTFSGWLPAVPATMTPIDVIYDAQWTVNNYDITYYVDGVLYQTVADQDYNSALTTIAAPTKTGYTFSGWSSADVTITAGAFTMPANNVRIDGTFTANSYLVTFDATPGTFTSSGNSNLVVPVDFDSLIAIPEEPVRAGYTFTGWVDADSAAVTLPIAMTTAGDITLTATWSADAKTYYVDIYEMTAAGTYEAAATQTLDFASVTDASVSYTAPAIDGFTVDATSVLSGIVPASGELRLVLKYARNQYTFNVTVDGVLTETTTDYLGAAITAPATPTKSGYTFAAWVDSENAVVAIPATMPLGGLDVYASWTVNSYDVTWNVDGVETVESYDFGDAITLPADPEKAGFSFIDWTPAVPATMPAEDVTFTAVFERNIYNVYYYIDGALTVIADVEYGSVIATNGLNYNVPDGYSLSGWFTDAAFETAFVTGTTMGAADVTIYAYTYVNTFDAEFYVDNVLYATVPTEFGAAIIAPADPTKVGSSFAGWSPAVGEMDAEGKRFDATFTAAEFTETFIVESTTYQVYYVNYGDDFDVPADPEMTGYTFMGWSLTEGGEVTALPATMGNANVTYYAIFAINSYDITYIVDGDYANPYAVENYDYGEAVIAVAEPTRVGYTFGGWTPAVPATMPANNVLIEGTFGINSYTLTYYVDGVQYGLPETYEFNAPIIPRDAPTQEGSTFSGWAPAVPATMPAANVDIYGTFSSVGYPAMFNAPEADVPYMETLQFAFGSQITAPAVDPVRAGYTFGGWALATDPLVALSDLGTMGEGGANFVAVWLSGEAVITYMVDGVVYATVAGNVGSPIDPIADPTKYGYVFSGWDGVVPTTMPADGVTLSGTFTPGTFTVQYIDYVPSAHGPALDPTRNTTTPVATYDVVFDTAIPAPAPPSIPYYNFVGWTDTDPAGGTEYQGGDPLDSEGLTLYAQYERVPVALKAATGKATVITRNADAKKCYITGLTESRGMTLARLQTWLGVNGDGTYVITPSERSAVTAYGTGTKVTVMDNVTGLPVESFYVVIYGDLNGDGKITTNDNTQLAAELQGRTWSITRGAARIEYMCKAANLNGDTTISTQDTTLLGSVLVGGKTLNQTTGLTS